MPTPADRQFFEALNKDLANSLSSAIKASFDEQEVKSRSGGANVKTGLTKETLKELITGISSGVGKEVAKGSKDKDKKPSDDKDKKDQKSWLKIAKTLGAFVAQNKLAQAAANTIKDTFKYGNIVARAAVATNNQQVLGTSLLNRKFEEFGVKLPEIGQIFKSAMKAGAGPLTKSQAQLFASTKLFDANIDTMIEFEARGVKAMGLSTQQSKELGSDMLHLAKANGIYADVLLEASVSMEATVRNLGLAHGDSPQLKGAFLSTASKLQAATAGMFKEDITSLMGKIAQIDPADEIKMRALIGQQGGDPAIMDKIRSDTPGYIADVFAIIGKAAHNDGRARTLGEKVFLKDFLEGIIGISKGELTATKDIFSKHGTAGIMELVRAEGPSEAEKATIESEMAVTQGQHSLAFQDAMLANAIAVSSLTGAFAFAKERFNLLSAALSGPGRDATIRTGQAAGLLSIAADAAMTVAAGVGTFIGVKKMFGGGGKTPTGGGGGSRSKAPKGMKWKPGGVPGQRGGGTWIKDAAATKGKGKLGGLLKIGALVAGVLGVGSLASAEESEGESIEEFEAKKAAVQKAAPKKKPGEAPGISGIDPLSTTLQVAELGMHGKTLAKAFGKAGSKSLAKKIPIIGAVAGAIFGISRALGGDFTGAAQELLSGLASTIPGPGTALSLGIDANLLARDVNSQMTGTDLGSAEQQTSDIGSMAISTLLNQLPGGQVLNAARGAHSAIGTDRIVAGLEKIASNTGSDGVMGVAVDQRVLSEKILEENRQLRAESNVTEEPFSAVTGGSSDFRLSDAFGWGGVEASVDNGS